MMYTQTFSTCWHFTWTVTLFIYFKVSTSVASTRLILVSDWLIAIYNNNNNFLTSAFHDECVIVCCEEGCWVWAIAVEN